MTKELALAIRIHRHIRIHDEMVRTLRAECHHEDCIRAAGMVLCQRCGSSWGEDDQVAPELFDVEVKTGSVYTSTATHPAVEESVTEIEGSDEWLGLVDDLDI